MTYNENFFDFFGLIEDEIRSVYSKSGKIIYIPELHIPAAKIEIPDAGINAIGIKVVTANKSNSNLIDIILYISIFALVVIIIWAIWYQNKPVSEDKENDSTLH